MCIRDSGYLYYKSVVPSPAYPDNWAIWIALIWAGAGLAVLLWLKLRHGALLAQTAEIIGSGDAPVERGLTSDIMESTRAGRSTPASGGPQ